jgi:hypothetical protein
VRHKLDGKFREIVTALEAWKQCPDWTKKNGAFIPAPSVWLNNSRWETAPELRERIIIDESEAAF